MTEPAENVSVTVKLLPKAWASVEDVAELTGWQKTDVINRAVQLYCYLEMERRVSGSDLALIESDGSLHRLSFSDDPEEIRKRFERGTERREPRVARRSWWPWKRGQS